MIARVCVGTLVAALLIAAWSPLASAAGEPTRAVESVAACVSASRQLLVYLGIDRSRSLEGTDPDARRVDGIKAALTGLSQLAAGDEASGPVQLEVLFGSFASEPSPSPARPSDWNRLDRDSLAAMLERARTYERLDDGRDTDYVLAFSAARAALDQRARQLRKPGNAPVCKLQLFLSDGKYQLTDRSDTGLPATVDYAPRIRLDRRGGPRRAKQVGRRHLCRPGGLMDQLAADDIVTFTVALSASVHFTRQDRAWLGALTRGETGGERCGDQRDDSDGAFFEVARSADLVSTFARMLTAGPSPEPRAICRRSSCPERLSFEAHPGISSFSLTAIGALEHGVTVVIRDPANELHTLSPGGADEVAAAGSELTQQWLTPFLVAVNGRFELDDDAWQGPWHVTFVGPPASVDDVVESTISLRTELRPRLAEETVRFAKDGSARVRVELVDHRGRVVDVGPLSDAASLEATVIDGQGHAHVARTVKDDSGFDVIIPATATAPTRVKLRVAFADVADAAIEPAFATQSLRSPAASDGKTPRWELLAAGAASVALLLGLLRSLWRRARFPRPHRMRAFSVNAVVTPGQEVTFDRDVRALGPSDWRRLANTRRARRRRIDLGALTLRAPLARQGLRRGTGFATAGGEPLVAGSGAHAGPAPQERVEIPLTLAGSWLFVVDDVDPDGRVTGELWALIAADGHEYHALGAELFERAGELLPGVDWSDLRSSADLVAVPDDDSSPADDGWDIQ